MKIIYLSQLLVVSIVIYVIFYIYKEPNNLQRVRKNGAVYDFIIDTFLPDATSIIIEKKE